MNHRSCLLLLVYQVPGFIALIYQSSLDPEFIETSPAPATDTFSRLVSHPLTDSWFLTMQISIV